MDAVLDGVETLGNKVPHPVLMFVYLIAFVIVLSTVLALFGVSVTEQISSRCRSRGAQLLRGHDADSVPSCPRTRYQYSDVDFEIREANDPHQGPADHRGHPLPVYVVRDELSELWRHRRHLRRHDGRGPGRVGRLDGRLDPQAGRRRPARTDRDFLIIFVGGLSSVASDAGYLILIPLAAAAFASLRRNPIAGLAAGFGGVAATFAVNIIIQPIDAMLGEMTNEAIALPAARRRRSSTTTSSAPCR